VKNLDRFKKPRQQPDGLAVENYHASLGVAYAGLVRKHDAVREDRVSAQPGTLARIYAMVGE
jgi:hypothetical protein